MSITAADFNDFEHEANAADFNYAVVIEDELNTYRTAYFDDLDLDICMGDESLQ